jgi:hypothetical protein
MCNPLALGIAAQAGGTYLKNQASNRADRLAGSAVDEFGKKNVALENEGRSAVEKTTNMFDQANFNAGQEGTTSRLAALFNDATNSPSKGPQITAGGPAIINNAMNEEFAKAAAFNTQQNNAMADLNSFGTYLANTINPAMNRSAEAGQMAGNMMGGNASVLNSQLRNAKNQAMSPLGDVLQTGGSLATGYGLKG